MLNTRLFLDASWARFYQAMGLGTCVLFVGVIYQYIAHSHRHNFGYLDLNFAFITFLAFFNALPSINALSSLKLIKHKIYGDALYIFLSFLLLLIITYIWDQIMLSGTIGSFSYEGHDLKYAGNRTFAGYLFKLKAAILHFTTLTIMALFYLVLRQNRSSQT